MQRKRLIHTTISTNIPNYRVFVFIAEITDELLERKIELCQELLDVAEILEPGFSKFRGLLLYDLQAAVVVQAKRRYQDGEVSREDVEVVACLKSGVGNDVVFFF